MLGRKPKQTPKLDEAIERVLIEMETVEPESEEYSNLLTRLERLQALTPDKEARRISPDTVVNQVGNCLQVLFMVGYEQKHVLTSKALGRMPKFKD